MDLTFDSLPPTFIVAGSKDRLARSSQVCADRLQQQSFNVEYKVYEGARHGFFTFNTPESRQLVDDIHEFLTASGRPRSRRLDAISVATSTRP